MPEAGDIDGVGASGRTFYRQTSWGGVGVGIGGGGGGGAGAVFGTISPFTYDAALTGIAVAAFLVFSLRIGVSAINALRGRRRRRRSAPGHARDVKTFLNSANVNVTSNDVTDVPDWGEESDIDALTKVVLPAVRRNWQDLPPFAPEVTYLGFEMLWNYWKERVLKMSETEETERRMCLSYRKLRGDRKESYRKARSSWAMLNAIGVSWTRPFLNAVERGLNGDSCIMPHSEHHSEDPT